MDLTAARRRAKSAKRRRASSRLRAYRAGKCETPHHSDEDMKNGFQVYSCNVLIGRKLASELEQGERTRA